MRNPTSHRFSPIRLALAVIAAACFSGASFALAGCGTVAGVGQDIQYASERTAEALSGDR